MSLNQRQFYFTTRGLRSKIIDVAENLDDPVTKRYESIQHENITLDHNLIELDQGTKARNRTFQERIDEIWGMTAGWEAKLKTESIESVESILSQRTEYEKHINDFEISFLTEVNDIFNRIDRERIPKETEYITKVENDMNHYYRHIVPPAIETQAGEVNRKLRKTYETFHIEQQKEVKRDRKFVNRVNKYWQSTAQKFNDEEALQDACFYSLDDDVVEYYRPISRMLPRRIDIATNTILNLRKVLQDIQKKRSDEDLDVLDTVIETQQLLQQIVILHFGMEDETFEKEREQQIIERIKFPKLTRRLQMMNSNSSSSKEEEGKEKKLEESSSVEKSSMDDTVPSNEGLESSKEKTSILSKNVLSTTPGRGGITATVKKSGTTTKTKPK